MRLEKLEHKHYPALFEVTRVCEPWFDLDRNTSDRLFAQREGFVVVTNEGKVVGHITFSDYTVKLDVIIHCSVLREYQTRWLTKSIYKECFDYVFNEMQCIRASGWAANGLTDLNFHERLGFKLEGIYRSGLRIKGNYYDLHRFGMLKSERKW